MIYYRAQTWKKNVLCDYFSEIFGDLKIANMTNLRH